MRKEVVDLLALGRFPNSGAVELEQIQVQQELLQAISPPVSEEEAGALVALFGSDDYFGLAWTLLHLVETASPGFVGELPTNSDNEWVRRLRRSAGLE